jgi:hypothetical protein
MTPGASVSPILPPQDGYLFQDKAKFPASFAADVDPEKAAFWADSQVPWGVVDSFNPQVCKPMEGDCETSAASHQRFIPVCADPDDASTSDSRRF